MQGWRISMEDAHSCILDLQSLQGDEELKPASSDQRISYFGVYDGHGGDKVALYTGDHLHNIIAKQEAFKSGNFEQALKDGFLAIDRAILSGTWSMHITPAFLFPSFADYDVRSQIRSTRKRCLVAHPQLASSQRTRFMS